jgi:hypothetical protein
LLWPDSQRFQQARQLPYGYRLAVATLGTGVLFNISELGADLGAGYSTRMCFLEDRFDIG